MSSATLARERAKPGKTESPQAMMHQWKMRDGIIEPLSRILELPCRIIGPSTQPTIA